MVGLSQKRSSDSPSTSSKREGKKSTSNKRTGGVADYFTILGVGDDLLWKHTQKQREQQVMMEQLQQQQGEGTDDIPNNPEMMDPNREDQAELMERFYREIIDVTILTHRERNINILHHATPSSVAPASSIMLTLSPSVDTDVNTVDSLASSRVRSTHQHPSILPSPSSHSEATTVATTILSSSDATYKHTNPPPPTEIDGFTLLSKTNRPQKHPHLPWPSPSFANTQQQPSPHLGPSISTSFSQGMETPLVQSSFPWNQKAAQGDANKDSYVFEANLDPMGGLRDHVCSTVLQWEESASDHHNSASSGASVSSSAASFKGLRRKVESSWKRWNQSNQHKQAHRGGATQHHHHSLKFFLGYKRRTPDQDHVPAVADLKLFYVQLPREATARPPSHHSPLLDPSTPPGSSAGLAGRVAAAAGHVLFRSHIDVDDGSVTLESHHQQEDFQRVDLEAVVPLPQGFDSWSIPEAFKVVYVPKSSSSARSNNDPPPASIPPNGRALRQKTVLLASPSHGERRRSRPHSPTYHDTQQPDIATANSTVDEAVEAYVQGSFSVPNSPGMSPIDDAAAEVHRECDSTEQPKAFFPKLLTDVPVEEDHDEAQQQHHHPFYHAEEKYWYIPIIAIRRQRTGEEERYHEDPGIVDLAVSFCDKAGMAVLPKEQDEYMDNVILEDDEEEFSLLSKTPWLVALEGDNTSLGNETQGELLGTGQSKKNNAFKTLKKSLGSPTILVKRNSPIGFADMAFATKVLDRFPRKNYKGLPLPEEELPMFCYPTGCRLSRARFSDASLPEYYGFVVKNERGDSIYVSCVSFMEPLTRKKVAQLSLMSEKRRRTCLAHRRFCEKTERKRSKRQDGLYCSDDAELVLPEQHLAANDLDDDDEDDNSDDCILTSFDSMTTFENKTICLVSRYPFWTAFRRFLSHLHILAGSTSDIPLERCISHLLLTVPVPKPGGPSVIVPLPALNQPMIMSLPPLKDFPLVDLPYQRLLACLDVSTIITIVLGLLALERKVSANLCRECKLAASL
jgi:DENN (AEX-3) domain/uDENN domain